MPNPFNRIESLTYNGVTIGQGSSLGELDGPWSLSLSPELGIVKCRFIVASTNSNALANMATIEAAFAVRRKALTIVFQATTVNSFDPTLATLTGYEAFPELRHGSDIPGPHSVGAETYELTVRFRIPADNYGRRDEHPALDKSLLQTRKVRFDGVWTAIAGSSGAREQFEDGTHGFQAHASTVLNVFDNAVTWTEVVHDAVQNDTDTEVSYHSEWWENVNGQVNEERTVHSDLHQLRRLFAQGTWIDPAGVMAASYNALGSFNDATTGFVKKINTYLSATYPGTFWGLFSVDPRVNKINGRVDYQAELWECEVGTGNVNAGRRFAKVFVDRSPSDRISATVQLVYMQTVVASVTKTAIDNFNDATNGGIATLAALQTTISSVMAGYNAHGNPIVWDEPKQTQFNFNEQLGIVEAEYRISEIPGIAQGPSAQNDAEICDDQWDLLGTTIAPGDTPIVLAGQASAQGTQAAAAGGADATRPVEFEARYKAWIAKGVDPITKWNSTLQSWVIKAVNTYLKPVVQPGALVRIVPEVDPRNNTITAHLTLLAFPSAYLEFSVVEHVHSNEGLIFSPRLSGLPDDYEEQQGPHVGTKQRVTHLLSTQADGITQFRSPKVAGPYRLIDSDVGKTVLKKGIPGFSTVLYAFELVEHFLLVGASAADTGGSEPTITLSGTGANQGANGGGQIPAQPDQISVATGSGGSGLAAGNGFGAGSVGIGIGAPQGASGGGITPSGPDQGQNPAFTGGLNEFSLQDFRGTSN